MNSNQWLLAMISEIIGRWRKFLEESASIWPFLSSLTRVNIHPHFPNNYPKDLYDTIHTRLVVSSPMRSSAQKRKGPGYLTFNTDRRTGSSWQRRVSLDREETGCDPCCALTIEVTSSRMVHEGWKRTLPGSKALRSDPWSGRRVPSFLDKWTSRQRA